MDLGTTSSETCSNNGHDNKLNGTNHRTLHDAKNSSNGIDMTSFPIGDSIEDVNGIGHQQEKSLSCVNKVFSWRYAIVILLHLSFMMATFARNCMPIALVCMTQTRFEKDEPENISLGNGSSTFVTVEEVEYEFSWDSETQGIILSSAAFLSFLAPMLASFIQPYFGHKNTLTTMTLVSAAVLFLSPVASRTSPWLLVALRIILGGTFGANVPAIADSAARWAPFLEKQTMVTIAFTGLQTGSTFCSLLSGYLCLIPVDNGWPFIFYVIGAIIVLWTIAWHFFCTISPEEHPYVSDKELKYIKQHRVMKESPTNTEIERPPYKTIFTSVPILALLVSGSLHYWSVVLIFTYMPIYVAAVLEFSVTETGVIMTCLGGARVVGMGLMSALISWLLSLKKWTPTTVKKFNVGYGALLSAACYLPAILFGSEQRWLIIGFLMLTMFFQSSVGSVFPVIPIDMAPRYAGFIAGSAFSLGGFLGIAAPLIAANLTPNNTAEEWQRVWIIGAGMYVCVCIIFVSFGDCSLQPWAVETKENPPEVVSPFDSMSKRFSAVLETSPVLAVEPQQVRDMDLVVEQDVRVTVPDVFTTETSGLGMDQPKGGIVRVGSSTELDGEFNDGFESELDRTMPPMKDQPWEQSQGQEDKVMVVRF